MKTCPSLFSILLSVIAQSPVMLVFLGIPSLPREDLQTILPRLTKRSLHSIGSLDEIFQDF